ncbi:PAS domain-containing protein [Candidatus Saccharibacteria bacterium]|nr:PAS domain-containing protein [Candidatus Saccharibacteria bacterium]
MIGLDDIFTRLETALEAGGIAWWEMELPSGVVFFSENKTNMLGRKAGDFTHYTHFTHLVHPEDYDQMMQAMEAHIGGKTEYYETRYRIQHKKGHYITYYDRGKIVYNDGKVTKIAGIVINMSEKRNLK